MKSATLHFCSMPFHLCESWILQKIVSVCQELGWLDHCVKEEHFSRLNCFHCSYVAHWWVLFNAQAAWAVSRRRSLEAVGSLCVVFMGLQKGWGRIGVCKPGWVWHWFCKMGTYDGTYWLCEEIYCSERKIYHDWRMSLGEQTEIKENATGIAPLRNNGDKEKGRHICKEPLGKEQQGLWTRWEQIERILRKILPRTRVGT